MVDLNFKVKGQKLNLLNRSCKLVNKTNNYINLYFTFTGSDWESTTNYAILNDSCDKSYLFSIVDSETPITVPSQIVNGNHFIVGVYGIREVDDPTSDEIRVTTNVYQINLKGSNYTTDLSSIEYETKDVISDIYDKITLLQTDMATKSDIGHTHTSNDITDLETRIDNDITLFATALENKIKG